MIRPISDYKDDNRIIHRRMSMRLVCHIFDMEEKMFMLVLLVPYSFPYRRISSKALAEIRLCFKNKT